MIERYVCPECSNLIGVRDDTVVKKSRAQVVLDCHSCSNKFMTERTDAPVKDLSVEYRGHKIEMNKSTVGCVRCDTTVGENFPPGTEPIVLLYACAALRNVGCDRKF